MMIRKITLSNIKSYVFEEIDFSNGINCILGLNGSGKSTIIESVGLALFNYSRSINQMLRYNETKGFIELEFVAKDNRLYRIIRTIRPKSNTVKLIDCEHDTELCSGTGDVYTFVKELLHIHHTKDLAKMFEEIIAVPQGQYVTAFLEPSAKRQANFDRLFDLHIYKELNSKIKDVHDYLEKGEMKTIKSSIDTLEGQLKPFDEKKETLNLVEQNINNTEKEFTQKEKQFQKTDKEKKHLEDIKNRLDACHTEKVLLENKEKNLFDLSKANNEELEKAKTAYEATEKHKSNYLRYQNNQEKITQEEQNLEKFLQLSEELKQTENNIKIFQQTIEHINEQTRNIETLIKEKKQNIVEINKESLSLQTALTDDELNYAALKAQLIAQENQLKMMKDDIQEKQANYRVIEKQADNMKVYDEKFFVESDKKLQKIKTKLQEIADVKEQIEEKEREVLVHKTNLDASLSYSQLTIDGTCPFLKTKCKNLDEGNLIDYFNNEINTFAALLKQTEDEIEQLKLNLVDEEQFIIEEQNINNQKQFYEEAKRQRDALQTTMKAQFPNIMFDPNLTLENQIQEIKKYLAKEVKETTNQEEKVKTIQKEVSALDNKISNARIKIEMHHIRMKDIEKESTKLKKEQLALSQKAIQTTEKIKESTIEIKRLEQEHALGKGIKTRLDKLKAENKELEKDKDAYLSNISKAKEMQQISDTVLRLHTQLEAIKKEIITNNELITQYEMEYSEEKLTTINKLHTKLIAEMSSLRTALASLHDAKKKLVQEIKTMEEWLKEKTKLQEKFNALENIGIFLSKMRDLVKGLPQQLSKAYREHIAYEATHLYRRISNEGVRIEIQEDYQVKIIDEVKDKNTKIMEQLSGGEQMSVVIAIRLAMLKHLSGLDVYFLDEPTINLDLERRSRIADVISEVIEELSQLFVISHDDTFDSITDSVIHIQKLENISKKM